jgi:hypothetical protein
MKISIWIISSKSVLLWGRLKVTAITEVMHKATRHPLPKKKLRQTEPKIIS